MHESKRVTPKQTGVVWLSSFALLVANSALIACSDGATTLAGDDGTAVVGVSDDSAGDSSQVDDSQADDSSVSQDPTAGTPVEDPITASETADRGAQTTTGEVDGAALGQAGDDAAEGDVEPSEAVKDVTGGGSNQTPDDGAQVSDPAQAEDPSPPGEADATPLFGGEEVGAGAESGAGAEGTQPDGASGGVGQGYAVDGTCVPECVDGSTDDDGDGWGFENAVSCIVAGSSAAVSRSRCDSPEATAEDAEEPATGADDAVGEDALSEDGGEADVGGATSGGTCPPDLPCSEGVNGCGCYVVPGLGVNKQRLLDAGADLYMIASAMMETEMMDTNYADGDGKTGDSWNGGTCKQNWGMMRECYEPWRGLGQQDFATARAMNDDPALDVAVYTACRDYFGDRWWAGHRRGWEGLNTNLTGNSAADVDRFKNAMDWTYQQLSDGEHFRDDVRFWAEVPAIIVVE